MITETGDGRSSVMRRILDSLLHFGVTVVPNAPKEDNGPRSLKDAYRVYLWLIIAVNTLFLYGILQTHTIAVSGLSALIHDANNLVPLGFAFIITTVMNGVLNEATKTRLVFFRWKCALPGHRAFSDYAETDPRINIVNLKNICGGNFPIDPGDQNRIWYQFYKTVENNPAVLQVHRDYLFTRDYAGLAALFIVFFGTTALIVIHPWRVTLTYFLLLIVQFALARQAATNYGIGFVTTVLAQKAAAPR